MTNPWSNQSVRTITINSGDVPPPYSYMFGHVPSLPVNKTVQTLRHLATYCYYK